MSDRSEMPGNSSKPKKVQIEAKSLEHAIVKAAGALGVPQDQVSFEIIKQSSGGLLSFLVGSKVEIVATVKPRQSKWRDKRRDQNDNQNRRQNRQQNYQNNHNNQGGDRSFHKRGNQKYAGKPSDRKMRDYQQNNERHDRDEEGDMPRRPQRPERTGPKKEFSPQEIETIQADIRRFCQDICQRMIGEDIEVTDTLSDDRLILDLDHDYFAEQTTKSSKLAEALEHILRKKPHHLEQELPFRIFVDVRGCRMKRENELIQMAKDLSFKVADSQRPIVLNYKSPYDRKIIHMALDKDERVYTKSIGSGSNRKLMILPAKGNKDSEDDKAPLQYQEAGLPE